MKIFFLVPIAMITIAKTKVSQKNLSRCTNDLLFPQQNRKLAGGFKKFPDWNA